MLQKKINVLIGQSVNANESKPCLKCSRPINSKDKNPCKMKGVSTLDSHIIEVSAQKEANDIIYQKILEEV